MDVVVKWNSAMSLMIAHSQIVGGGSTKLILLDQPQLLSFVTASSAHTVTAVTPEAMMWRIPWSQ